MWVQNPFYRYTLQNWFFNWERFYLYTTLANETLRKNTQLYREGAGVTAFNLFDCYCNEKLSFVGCLRQSIDLFEFFILFFWCCTGRDGSGRTGDREQGAWMKIRVSCSVWIDPVAALWQCQALQFGSRSLSYATPNISPTFAVTLHVILSNTEFNPWSFMPFYTTGRKGSSTCAIIAICLEDVRVCAYIYMQNVHKIMFLLHTNFLLFCLAVCSFLSL